MKQYKKFNAGGKYSGAVRNIAVNLEQRYRSFNTVLKTITDTYSMAPVDMTHLHLLMYLYHTLGHSNKETIRQIMKIMRCNWKPFYADCFTTMPKFERYLKSKKAFLWA